MYSAANALECDAPERIVDAGPGGKRLRTAAFEFVGEEYAALIRRPFGERGIPLFQQQASRKRGPWQGIRKRTRLATIADARASIWLSDVTRLT